MPKESVRNLIGLITLVLTIPALLVWFNTNRLTTAEGSGSVEGVTSSKFTHVTPAEFNQALDSISNREILDVRTPEEFEQGHIDGAINIDFYSEGFESEISKLDREATYLIYCKTGQRSTQTVNMMKEMGFENVKGLAGGINSWAAVFDVTEE